MKNTILSLLLLFSTLVYSQELSLKGTVIERGGYSQDHVLKLIQAEKTLYLDTFIMFSAFTL